MENKPFPGYRNNSLDTYIKTISKEAIIITPEEEIELAARIGQGDPNALHKLIKGNIRFVVSIAKQYKGYGLPLEDLISEGVIGLINAAMRFNEPKGFMFITSAVQWIRKSIIEAISKYSDVELPLPDVHTFQIEKYLEEENNSINPMDLPFDKEHDSSNEKHINDMLKQKIEESLMQMDIREAEVIRMSFGLADYPPMSVEEISSNLFLSCKRVKEIRKKALQILKANLQSKN